MVLAHKHISEIQVLDSAMAAIVTRQLFAAFVIFIYHGIIEGPDCGNPRSENNRRSHILCLDASVAAMSSAAAVLSANNVCFRLRQLKATLLIVKTHPVADL